MKIMMHARRLHILLFCVCLVLMPGCSPISDATLSDAHIKHVSQNVGVQAQSIHHIGRAMSVLVLDTPSDRGCIFAQASGNQPSDVALQRETLHSATGLLVPEAVSVFSSASDRITVACVIIQDPALQQQATSLRVVFDDGETIEVAANGQPHYVIAGSAKDFRDENATVMIFDAQGKQLAAASD